MTHPRPIILSDSAQMIAHLNSLRDIGAEPNVAGMDAKGRSFLAQFASLNGEYLYEVVWENPTATKKDKRKGEDGVCRHCGAVLDRHSITELAWPVSVLTHDIDVLIPEGGRGEPVVEQPPPVDEIEELLNPGKGKDK